MVNRLHKHKSLCLAPNDGDNIVIKLHTKKNENKYTMGFGTFIKI